MNLDAIRAVEMFQGLSETELGNVFRLAKPTSLRSGETVVREGAPGGMLHIILEGQVEVRKKTAGGAEKPLARLEAGSVFGEMSLFDGYPYSASIVTTRDTETLSMFRNDFMTLAETDPGVAFKITSNLIRILSQKLRKTNENLISLAMLRQVNEA